MNSQLALALLASAVIVPAAGCSPATANPISTGSGASSSVSSSGSSVASSSASSSGLGTGGMSASSSSSSTVTSTASSTGSGSSTSGTSTSGTGGSSTSACAPICGSGEVCVDGACHGLVQLAAVGAPACMMLLDATHVYLATNQVETVAKADGKVTAPGIWIPGPALAADDTYLYFNAESGGLERSLKTGGFGQGFAGESLSAPVTAVVSDGTAIYYMGAATDSNPPAVYETTTSAPADAGVTDAIFATNIYGIGTVAVDATSVYYCGPAATLVREDKTSKVITSLGSDCPTAIIPDGANVLYSVAPSPGAGGKVATVSVNGGAVTTLVDPTVGMNGVFAADAQSIYFMTFSAVMKVAKTGGAPVTVTPLSLTTPYATCMAADDAHVYWIDDGKLMQYTK